VAITPARRPARAAPRGADTVTLLTFFVVLLFAIPSRLVFAPLGGAGGPAQLLGMGGLLWWAWSRLAQSSSAPTSSRPVRRAMLLFMAACLASYLAATVRPIDPVELRAADRGVLCLCAWLGILLLTADGTQSRARFEVLLRRVVAAGGAIATLGILQFETGLAFTNLIQVPGLSENSDLIGVGGREGFNRPAGTALHPIEFGIVLTMVLPLAIHFAMADRHRPWLRRWYPVLALAFAIPISISRSAIVCTVVGLAFMFPTWSRSRRRRAYAAIAGLLVVVFVTIPGMLGTLVGLFSGIGSDSSALSRTGSYALAWEFIGRTPFFGRGFQTFLPEYRILDNQYLLVTIEVGFLGLGALLWLFGTGVRTGLRIRRRSSDPQVRGMAQALAASIAAGAFGFVLFDAFSFPQLSALVFLVLGAVEGLHRLQALELSRSAEPAVPAPPPDA
jgi:O-antigen ligase